MPLITVDDTGAQRGSTYGAVDRGATAERSGAVDEPRRLRKVMIAGAILMACGVALAAFSSATVAANPTRDGMTLVAVDETGEETPSFHKSMIAKPSASLSEYPEGWFWDDDWSWPTCSDGDSIVSKRCESTSCNPDMWCSSWFTWWLCPGGSKPLVTCSDSSGSTYNVVGDCEDDCECNDDDYCE
eukprot:CAMPEP_0182563346 /NCGR_PEP_ID=MMETSP1324-20130603/5509_1 /TAXON_ID=236786 /ORGANISM="Florenciella sp., Strain RCC1587" /LENGTH=185 /DNA_ID=CAMNT_0024776523 /DNA_START=92 /DNA_END=649 /DNA_ORIENTATION=-